MSIRHLLDRRAARSTRSLSGTIFRGLLLFVVGVTAAFALVLAGLYYLSPERAPEDQMVAFLGSLMAPVAVALLAAALLALLLSRLITRRIMRPLDAMDLAEPLHNEHYAEMAPLLERIDSQQRTLRAQPAPRFLGQRLARDEDPAPGDSRLRRAHGERPGAARGRGALRRRHPQRVPGYARPHR